MGVEIHSLAVPRSSHGLPNGFSIGEAETKEGGREGDWWCLQEEVFPVVRNRSYRSLSHPPSTDRVCVRARRARAPLSFPFFFPILFPPIGIILCCSIVGVMLC